VTTEAVDYEAQDRAARKSIKESLGQTFFVEAGAGTGKTSALVDRVVALVLAGRRIERLVAITFTEKAAAELRDRIRGGLEEARAGAPAETDIIDAALGSLDRAQLSTIHSFCAQLLHSFAAEAGVDPSFRVEDEVRSQRRFQDRWRIYLDQIPRESDAEKAINRVLGLGLTTADIETLARELSRQADLAWRLEAHPVTAPAAFWPNVKQMAERLAALPLSSAPPDDELRLRVERLLSFVRDLSTAENARETVLASGAAVLELRWQVSRASEWGPGGACRQVRDSAKAIAEQLKETLELSRSEALAGLMPVIVQFVLADARERGREGILTFDDLIVRVRDLLRDNPESVRSLRDRYDVMLIDEFQDTDPLQVDIARCFAQDPQTGKLQPGRLFLVGDPKQSIYRFRRADMAVYSKTRDEASAQGAEFADLALNRRSRPEVLDWVNSVFSTMIGDGGDPDIQPSYRPIHPSRGGSLNGPGIARMGDALEDTRAAEARRVEADALAAQCHAVLDDGWEVMDRTRKRTALLRDIAILIPARAILAPLERALAAAAIPYRVESGSLIYRTLEVRDLINCLTAIDDPSDEVAVVGALRSPAFACSDVELARHKGAGGSFNYLAPSLSEHDGPVAGGLRVLGGYHKDRHDRSLAALIERFAADRCLAEVGILDQGSRNAFRRVRFVVEQARAFESGGPESLRAFVVWMERRFNDAILDNEGGGVDDDEDAVRVFTIHGAKGLEFPIVFLAGLGWSPSNRGNIFTIDRATGDTAVSIGAKGEHRRFVLGDAEQISRLESTHREAEFARWLYVAATRARDHLLVSLYHASRNAGSTGAARLIAAGAREYAVELMPKTVAATAQPPSFFGLAVDPPGSHTPEAFKDAREALVKASQRKKYWSATAIMDERRAVAAEDKNERDDESEPWARGRGGTQRGRAVHAAIQSLPLDAGDAEIDAFSRAQAVAEAIPHREAEVGAMVRWVLRSSQAAVRARAAPRALREVPFAVEENDVVLEGFVDLLIQTYDGIEIVDWKTDQIRPDRITARLEEYRLQAGLYVIGIEAATGQPVTRITYVFADPGIEESPGDPAALAVAARLALASPR